jgi:hypothetical protein
MDVVSAKGKRVFPGMQFLSALQMRTDEIALNLDVSAGRA